MLPISDNKNIWKNNITFLSEKQIDRSMVTLKTTYTNRSRM